MYNQKIQNAYNERCRLYTEGEKKFVSKVTNFVPKALGSVMRVIN